MKYLSHDGVQYEIAPAKMQVLIQTGVAVPMPNSSEYRLATREELEQYIGSADFLSPDSIANATMNIVEALLTMGDN